MTDDGHSAISFTVTPQEADSRLDLLLVERMPDLSRSRIQRALASGAATVDGRPRPSNYRVHEGSLVAFTPPEPPPPYLGAQDIPLRMIHCDDHLVVIDKPAGMVVHPAPGHRSGTMVNALLHLFGDLPGDSARAGLVHRLDKDTSGLLAVARTDLAHRGLSAQLRARTLGRTYAVVSWGQWDADEGLLAEPIGRHPHRRRMMAVVAGGRPAGTRYRVVEDFGFVQHCEAQLQTGRTHQIRVHFAHGHHPVVGDPLYGDDARERLVHPLDRHAAQAMVARAGRQMLHARELRLRHPATGEQLVFTSELPEDFAAVLEILRRSAPSA
ncbi:MAG: RluA family pseudouridine synthase [bacterium]|nr:RluA family pseudouridine synthase [bacterium]